MSATELAPFPPETAQEPAVMGTVGVNRWAIPGTPECAQFDRLEEALAHFSQAEFPLVHRFTPGLYIREFHAPAGSLTTTAIHTSEHPFVISQGKISIFTDDGGVEHHAAPYCGITKPGTRRIIMHHTATVLTTFHVTNETDPDKIIEQIILKHDDHLKAIPGFVPRYLGGVGNQPKISS